MRKCVFCGTSILLTKHHILPKKVKKHIGLYGRKAKDLNAGKKITVCEQCHRKLTLLQEPLCMVIQETGRKPNMPREFGYLMTGVAQRLNEELI